MAIIQSIIFASAIVLIMLVNEGSAIRCFTCNSNNVTSCADKIPPDDYKIDCSTLDTVNYNGRIYSHTFCRKIHQIVDVSKDLPPDIRIIRSCGWEDSKYLNQCYKREGYGGKQVVCACKNEDLCNSSNSLISDTIKCYQCNSYFNPGCEQDKPPMDLVVDCSTIQDGHIYKFCRKITQNIEFSINNLPPDSRVIRGCGHAEHVDKDACYKKSGFGGKQVICACSEADLCNGSPSSFNGKPILFIFMLTLFTTIAYIY